MATHSSPLAWRLPWTEEPGELSPRGRKDSDSTERLLTLSLTLNDNNAIIIQAGSW